MLTLAILGLLEEQELHGYELRKRLAELPAPRLAVSYGSLYPALAKLERRGAVKAVTQTAVVTPSSPMSGSLTGELAAYRADVAATPDRGSRGKRGKKVYGLTDRGREQLHELLVHADVGDQEFPVAVAFCHLLSPPERLLLFERRLTELTARQGAQSPPRNPSPYLRSLIEHESRIAAAHVAWARQLISDEQAASALAAHASTGDQP